MRHSVKERCVHPARVALLIGVAGLFLGSTYALAQEPPGYYGTVDLTNSTTAHLTLHEIIDDHTRFEYTSTETDTWDILNLADEDPNNINNIIDVYRNASYGKISGGVGAYNREHVWPKSYGFPTLNQDNYPYTDCHHLFLSDGGYNSSRSNKPFRFCNSGCAEKLTDFNNGRGGGTGVYPGNSNWTTGSFTQGTWETWGGRKGDVARAIFYMAARYDGGTHGITGAAEPDLIVTDSETQIDSGKTGANESIAYMGMLSDLLQWHVIDPVDDDERWHNEIVYSFQGNRNPFVDHPEWVSCVFQNICTPGPPDTTSPAAPSGLAATAGNASVDLTWMANGESDLAGYNLFRSTTTGGPYTKVNGALISGTSTTDTGLTNGTIYFYVLQAVDTSNNSSPDSNEASATPDGAGGPPPGGGSVILSEAFYDASGTDDGLEWVELFNAGTTAVDLSTYSLGNGGTSYTYSTVQLSGTIPSGATFVVGGLTSNGTNGNPTFDLVANFSPDFQNSGATADGVALFDVPASQISSSVPIDAVIYGGSNINGLIDETGVANPPEVGDATVGSSLERIDLAGTWQIQGIPNPNSTTLPPLSAGNDAPVATITSPAGGSTFSGGTSVALSGTASDTEDGDISASLSWTSSLDGILGAGASVSAILSIGIHSITATATDSQGATGSDSIIVTVTATANAAPTVSVTTPINGSSFTAGASVNFVGTASDPEDGDLTASISWSSNLDGTLGSGGSVTTSALSVGNHTVTASVTDSGGLTAAAQLGLTITSTAPGTITLTSIAADDGRVRESSENSNVGGKTSSTASGASSLRAGDDKKGRQWLSVVSFDTSSVPAGATIVSATLRLRRGGVRGTNPFDTHGQMFLDISSGGFGGDPSLADSDFEATATATQAGTMSNAPSNGNWSEGTLNASGLAAINSAGITQLRFYFELDDNDDGGDDYIGYRSGEDSIASNHPELVIAYQP